MADSQVAIQIPEGLIRDLVYAAVARELGGQKELIEGVVSAALTAKRDHYSSTQSIFLETVQKMIRDVAQEAVKDWIEANKDRIKTAFEKHLSSRDGAAVKKLVEGMVDGVGRYNVSVSFNWKDS